MYLTHEFDNRSRVINNKLRFCQRLRVSEFLETKISLSVTIYSKQMTINSPIQEKSERLLYKSLLFELPHFVLQFVTRVSLPLINQITY